jgi:4-amino-4-deoxy-L-arabinose transferase-like glycosyltransferase
MRRAARPTAGRLSTPGSDRPQFAADCQRTPDVVRSSAQGAEAPTWWPSVTVALASAAVLVWRLGRGSLISWDEAIYAQVAKEVASSGDWLTFRWGGRAWFEKPPLFIWSVALLYRLFEVNEYWARVPAVVAGVGLAVTTRSLAARLYGAAAGWLAWALLLSTFLLVRYARMAMTDVPLTCLIILGGYAYVRLRSGSPRWWVLVWSSTALAIMIKSAAGLLLPPVIGAAVLIDGQARASLRSKHFWLGAAVAAVIVMPWHVFMLTAHGRAFLDQYMGFHVVQRVLSPIESNVGPRHFYLLTLPHGLYPWYFFLPFGLAAGVRELVSGRRRSLIPLLTACAVFGAVAVVRTKVTHYVLPAYPAFAILMAAALREALRAPAGLEFGGLVVAVACTALIAPRGLVLGLAVTLLALLVGARMARRSPLRPITTLLATFLLVVAVDSIRLLYKEDTSAPVKMLARMARSVQTTDREPLVLLGVEEGPVALFYSDRPPLEVPTLGELALVTKRAGPTRVLLHQAQLTALAARYTVDVQGQADEFVYALIQPRPQNGER